MILNPLFSKSGKGLNSSLKHPIEKPNKNSAKLHKKPKFQTCFKGKKSSGPASKALQITWVYIFADSYCHRFEFLEDSANFKLGSNHKSIDRSILTIYTRGIFTVKVAY